MHARMLSVVVLHVVFFIRTEYELYGCDALSDPNYGLIQITGLRSNVLVVRLFLCLGFGVWGFVCFFVCEFWSVFDLRHPVC